MCQKVVIPARCTPPEPESRSFNRSCKPYLNLDSRFPVRPAGCPGMTKHGFTLIELLVVVLIIGILSVVALPQYTKAVEKSRAVQAVILVKSIRDAAEIYRLANGVYPSSLNDLDIERPAAVKDFTWDDPEEWRDGRFSLTHSKRPSYLIIASGLERSSPVGGIDFLKGKVYCWSDNAEGIRMCKIIGVRKLEGVVFRGEFWEL